MVENVANRPLETTRHLKRRSPRDRIIFISEKKENKMEIHNTDQNKDTKVLVFIIILIYEKGGFSFLKDEVANTVKANCSQIPSVLIKFERLFHCFMVDIK